MLYEGTVQMTKPFWNFNLKYPGKVEISAPSNLSFRINGEEQSGNIRIDPVSELSLEFYSTETCDC
jgi:hypothetical protein